MRVTTFLILSILYFGAAIPTSAQDSPAVPEQDPVIEAILNDALDLASQNQWEKALELIDEAEAIAPDYPKIAKYRRSILELQAVNTAQESWETGEASDVLIESPNIEEDSKFVIERDQDDVRANPGKFRDLFRGQVSAKLIANNTDTLEWINPWSSLEELAFSGIGANIRFWFPFFERSLGLNLASSGYSWQPGEPDWVFNALDFGINLRGFLAEKQLSRLEIGLDIGVSQRTMLTLADNTRNPNTALYLGLWASDSIFSHLFGIEKLDNLILGGKIHIYAPLDPENRESVHYGVNAYWRFKNLYTGFALEWWDFFESSTQRNQASVSLLFGTHFR